MIGRQSCPGCWYSGAAHLEDCPESLRNKYPETTREDLLKEIMADPGNKLFGKPLSEIQRMICVEESLGNPSRTILLAALELAVAELNEWNDTYNMKRETPEDWIKTAEEALKEKPE